MFKFVYIDQLITISSIQAIPGPVQLLPTYTVEAGDSAEPRAVKFGGRVDGESHKTFETRGAPNSIAARQTFLPFLCFTVAHMCHVEA